MNNYWQNLSERERLLMIIGGAFAALWLFYLLVYAPIVNAVKNKSKLLVEKRETLGWMQQVRGQARHKNTRQVINSPKLLALMSNQLNNKNLAKFPYQLQQTDTLDIQLSFPKVPFNDFLAWAWALDENYAITLKQIDIEHLVTPGIVKVKLTVALSQ